MIAERYIPVPELSPFIKTFMIIESADGMENKLLPDTSLVMAFRIRGRLTQLEDDTSLTELPLSTLTGIKKSARVIRYGQDAATLLAIFEEGGAGAFFEEPLHELWGMSLPLADLVSQGMLSRVEEQLAAAGNNLQRVSIIEQFLLSRLMPVNRDQRILEAVQKIKLAHGNLQISKLPKELYMSQDSFEKKFRRIIGTSPKQYARIIRFRNLIFSRSASNRLTDLAHTSGYFDQAHFIKDFRTFTGQAPGDFFKNSRFW